MSHTGLYRAQTAVSRSSTHLGVSSSRALSTQAGRPRARSPVRYMAKPTSSAKRTSPTRLLSPLPKRLEAERLQDRNVEFLSAIAKFEDDGWEDIVPSPRVRSEPPRQTVEIRDSSDRQTISELLGVVQQLVQMQAQTQHTLIQLIEGRTAQPKRPWYTAVIQALVRFTAQLAARTVKGVRKGLKHIQRAHKPAPQPQRPTARQKVRSIVSIAAVLGFMHVVMPTVKGISASYAFIAPSLDELVAIAVHSASLPMLIVGAPTAGYLTRLARSADSDRRTHVAVAATPNQTPRGL